MPRLTEVDFLLARDLCWDNRHSLIAIGDQGGPGPPYGIAIVISSPIGSNGQQDYLTCESAEWNHPGFRMPSGGWYEVC